MAIGGWKVDVKMTPKVGFRAAFWLWALAVYVRAPEIVLRPLRALVASRFTTSVVALALVLLSGQASASPWRKQSSTSRPVQWLMVSSTDHLTPSTGLTVTATCSKDGGAFGACSGSVSEVGNGIYSLAGDATDRGTLGTLVIRATAAGADTAYTSVEIVSVDPFDGDFGLADLDAAVSSRLAPTTAGRTLDVTAAGEAGIDWANIGSPTTTVNLSGTTVKTATDIATTLGTPAGASVSSDLLAIYNQDALTKADTDDIQTRLPAGLIGGRMDSSVGVVASGAITEASIADDAITAAKIAADAFTSDELAASFVSELAIPTVGQIADGVWDEPTPHNTASTMGALLTSAGAAGDPWSTALPGIYTSTQAGARLAAIQSRTDLISAGSIAIVAPFNPTSGKLTLTRGDDYASGTLPAFTSSGWPNLTGATVRLTIRRRQSDGSGGTVLLTMTDTTASRVAGTGEQSVLFEPLSALGSPVANNQSGTTNDLVPGANTAKWDIQATLSGGAVRTLATGLMDVVEDITRP